MTVAEKKVGFAVVGLGSIAQGSVLPAFAHCKKARLVALVSRDKRKAARLARRSKGVAFYGADEYAACLSNPEIDAVYVATPQGVHESATVQAARARKHVLCEKPLAATSEQSRRMVDACRKNGVLLMTAYRKYFEPSTVYLKRLIGDGKLGRIDTIHTGFSELFTPGISPAWLLKKKLAGGGPLTDLGIYCVNTTRWMVDEDPVEVTAESWRHDRVRFRQVEEGISFCLRFPSGLIIQASSTYSAAPSSFICVQGSEGWASLMPAYDFKEERWLTAKIAGRQIERRFRVIDEFAPELDAFASAIQGRSALEPDGLQGHRDVIILQSIYDAARRRKPVTIRYE